MSPVGVNGDCPHLECVGEITKEELIQKSHGKCQDCKVGGPNLWACLENGCTYVGCGESHADHSTGHSQDTRHNLTVNLTTLRVWCYACGKEVFLERKLGPRSPAPSAKPHSPLHTCSQDVKVPGSPGLRIPQAAVCDDLDTEMEEEDEFRTRGLTGLKNIGNTCYMNAALQALSNCPPLTQFFLDCGGLVRTEKKPALCKTYQKLVSDIWHKNRPGYVVPTSLFQGIKAINPLFRGYSQQDSQEFLRCLMDQLHEELKEVLVEPDEPSSPTLTPGDGPEDDRGQSDNDFQSCESCGSSDRAEGEAKPGAEEPGEVAMLIPEEEVPPAASGRGRQKEKNRGSRPCRAGSSGDVDKDIDTAAEPAAAAVISSQGAVKVPMQGRASDCYPDVPASVGSSRSHSPTPNEAINAKLSSSPPKTGPVWSGLAPSHKKGCLTLQIIVSDIKDQIPLAKSPFDCTDPVKVIYFLPPFSLPKNKTQKKYRSVISDVFDGTIVSSVQCLTCDRVSVTLETFQDISLPIPGKEDLAKLHSSSHQTSLVKAGSCGEAYAPQGWIAFVMEYIKSWFWGPVVTLQDCLAAFFARDELKGDNMYSCEKCKKLRNGVKFCKVQSLPEVLCIHLKRFRHELMFSTKIGTHVSFPLEGLDMQPFLAKDSTAQTTSYDLLSVICHHGTASSGHYIAYCRNDLNGLWYEFDDQSVTEVSEVTVQNAEAYVLFYKKSNEEAQKERRRVSNLLSMLEPSLLQFYISRQWLSKFKTFAEPGSICNNDFLCSHGGWRLKSRAKELHELFQNFEQNLLLTSVHLKCKTCVPPHKASYIEDLVLMLPQNVWEYLYSRYGGGPAVNHLYVCHTCQTEIEKLEKRRKTELDMFVRLNKAFQEEEAPAVIYCISMQWFREWEGFVKGKDNDPPGPIDNTKIAVNKNGHITLKQGADSGQISEETWNFLQSIYGGGPDVTLRPSVAHQDSELSHAEEKIEVETRSV